MRLPFVMHVPQGKLSGGGVGWCVGGEWYEVLIVRWSEFK